MKLRYKITSGILVFLVLSIASLALVLSHTSECGQTPAVSGDVKLMQAVVYRCYGSPDVLELVEVEKPSISDNGILVRVHAASVNPLDWHYMRGLPYIMRLETGLGAPKRPRLGVDFAGTVEAVGHNVRQFTPGDAVFGGTYGAFAEYITMQEHSSLARKPANITFELAAAVPIAGLTALQALRDHGKIYAGQKVLINGASGGVGTFAVQIARAYGAVVTGVSSTRNLDMVRSIGADHVIDYTREDYTESEARYDLIIDNVGNHPVLANTHVLEPDGRLILVGAQKGDWLRPLQGVIESIVISPFIKQEVKFFLAVLREDDLVTLAELMQSGKVRPVIDRSYPLRDVPAAIRYLEEGHASGKIVINAE